MISEHYLREIAELLKAMDQRLARIELLSRTFISPDTKDELYEEDFPKRPNPPYLPG
jgi:hypothetical protein